MQLQTLEEIENDVFVEQVESSPFVFHDKWLDILPSATKEDVIAKAQQMVCIEEDLPFYHGRLMRELRDRFGMSHEDIALLMNYDSKQTVADRISVDSRVPVENRSFGRSIKYSHYRMVAALGHEEQVKWLTMAEKERIGANTLFAMIKESQGLGTPLRFSEPKPKNDHGIEPLAALGSADGGGADYVVDRQDEGSNSYGNDKLNGNGRYDDIDYALGPQAERLSHESDLEDDVYQLRLERDRLREQLLESEERRKDTLEALDDLQEKVTILQNQRDKFLQKINDNYNDIFASLEIGVDSYDQELLSILKRTGVLDSSQCDKLSFIKSNYEKNRETRVEGLYYVLWKNHVTYDPYLLKSLRENGVITDMNYNELMKRRNNDASFDEPEYVSDEESQGLPSDW